MNTNAPAHRGGRQTVAFGPFRFDSHGLVLSRDGAPVSIQPRALEVLRCLVDRAGEVLLKQDLMDLVWDDVVVTETSLGEAIRLLRKALGDDSHSPTYIETVHRRGYRFISAVHLIDATGPANGAAAQSSAMATDQASTPVATRLDDAAPTSVHWRARLGTAAAFVLGGVSVAAAMWVLAGENPPVTATMFSIEAPPGTSFWSQQEELAISPDGMTLVFMATGGDRSALYTRRLDDLDMQSLSTATERQLFRPFFSSDGRRIGFFSGALRGLETLDLATGEVEAICSGCAPVPGRLGGGIFGPGGSIVFAYDGRLWSVPAGGGDPQVVPATPLDGPEAGYWWPSFLPGGEWIVVTMLQGHNISGAQLGVVHLPSGETHHVLDDAVSGRYVPSGHLVFARDGGLWAVSFDADARQLRGEPALIQEGLQMRDRDGFAAFTVSDTGTLAYHPGDQWQDQHQVVSSDAEGNSEPLIAEKGLYRAAQLSPDGRKLAVCFRDATDEIRVYDLDLGGEYFRIARSGIDVCDPIWNPDGTMLAYSMGGHGIFVREPLPEADARNIVPGASWMQPMDWAAGGQIVYLRGGEHDPLDIWTVDVRSGEAQPFLATDRTETGPRISPDGNWLAYWVDHGMDPVTRAPDWRVEVVPFPGGGPPIEISDAMTPRWAPDGRELYFYRRYDGWMAVPLQGGMDLVPGEPRRLGLAFRGLMGIQPHGDRFIQIEGRVGERPRTTEIVVVTNWFETLRELAAPGRR